MMANSIQDWCDVHTCNPSILEARTTWAIQVDPISKDRTKQKAGRVIGVLEYLLIIVIHSI